MRNWNFLGTFFQRSSRLVKVMVKLWGGMSSILIEGVRPTFIQLLIFYRFYWFLSISLIFYRFYWFYWFFIDFIDFYRFYWFLSILLIFTDFIDFSTILSIFVDFLTSFAYFQQFLNQFSPIYRTYIFLKRYVMYNIDQVLLWGVTRPLAVFSVHGGVWSSNFVGLMQLKLQKSSGGEKVKRSTRF